MKNNFTHQKRKKKKKVGQKVKNTLQNTSPHLVLEVLNRTLTCICGNYALLAFPSQMSKRG